MDMKKIINIECKEYATEQKGYIIYLFGLAIPLKEFMATILTFVLVIFAVNFGYAGNADVVKLSAHLCNDGIYDQTTHLWTKCYPVQNGTTLSWSCINNSKTFNPSGDPFNSDNPYFIR